MIGTLYLRTPRDWLGAQVGALLTNLIRIAPTLEKEPSNYMQTLTRYLSNIMNSVLLGLPTEIKELIYFDALSHAATMILVSQYEL